MNSSEGSEVESQPQPQTHNLCDIVWGQAHMSGDNNVLFVFARKSNVTRTRVCTSEWK